MENLLEIGLADFKQGLKNFKPKRETLGQALLAFENGFLSIEAGNVTSVIRAKGKWNGRAKFSGDILKALAAIPPKENPVVISYAEGHLFIANIMIPCRWVDVGKTILNNLQNPGTIDLIALGRTMPRAEFLGSEIGKQIKRAEIKAERDIKRAIKALADLEVSETDIRILVERNIRSRIVN